MFYTDSVLVFCSLSLQVSYVDKSTDVSLKDLFGENRRVEAIMWISEISTLLLPLYMQLYLIISKCITYLVFTKLMYWQLCIFDVHNCVEKVCLVNFLLQVAQIKISVTIPCRCLEGCSIVYFNHIIMLSPNFHLRRGAHVDAPDETCEPCP